MTELVIETAEGVRLRHEIAGAGSRAAAGMIDLGICGLAWFILFLVSILAAGLDPSGLAGFVLGLLAGGTFLFLVVYQVAWGVFGSGRTVGRRLLGIRVLDLQGTPASWVQHALRSLFWPLEVFTLVPIPIGIVFIAMTSRHQRLGDFVAGTIVLRDVDGRASGDPYSRQQWSEMPNRRLPLVPALAERLDGEDLAYLRNLLARRAMDAEAGRKLLQRSARHYATVLGFSFVPEPSPSEARQMLRELYLFLRETRGAYSSSR